MSLDPVADGMLREPAPRDRLMDMLHGSRQ